MIWAKTDAGRIEMQARALVTARPVRNLLLLIDGQKSEDLLLASLAGIGRDDFHALQKLGLIAPVGTPAGAAAPAGPTAAPIAPIAPREPNSPAPAAASAAPAAPVGTPPAPPAPAAPLDYAQFTAALTQIIAKELGLRGFMLTLAVEKASTAEELQDVARRTLEQLRDRKGEAAAAAARRALYGG